MGKEHLNDLSTHPQAGGAKLHCSRYKQILKKIEGKLQMYVADGSRDSQDPLFHTDDKIHKTHTSEFRLYRY